MIAVQVFLAAYPYDNVITVMAIDPDGAPARSFVAELESWLPYTNYGKTSVDIAAPGSLVLVFNNKASKNWVTAHPMPLLSSLPP